MCSPIATNIAAFAANVSKDVLDTAQERKNAKYNSQVAISNAKLAIAQAKQEEQTGIKEAREEKIKGIQEANRLYAQNASGGFDANSTTSLYNVQDTYTTSESSAQSILDNYKQNAQNYYTKANNYINESKNIISNYNSSLLTAALGMNSKVGDYWGDFNTDRLEM